MSETIALTAFPKNAAAITSNKGDGKDRGVEGMNGWLGSDP